MAGAIDFQPYLQSLPSSVNQGWGDRYTQTQVELPLKVRAIVEQRPDEASTQSQPEEKKTERFEVLNGLRKAVAESDRVLLIGKPGSGKSTALRRLLWEEAQTGLEQLNRGQDTFTIPVLVELRDCKSGSVLEWIQNKALRRSRLQIEDIEDLLFTRRLLLLFDGVNELPSDDAWSALDEFCRDRDFCTTPMIFTTRSLGAGADLGIEKKLEMVPLTELQMRDFIQKRLPGKAENLLRQLQGRLRELAETPLLLQMLCDVVAESADGTIPQNRGELFRKEFARRYETFKPLRGRVSEDCRRFAPELLQHLAFVMTQGEPHTDPLKPTSSWLTIPKSQAEIILENYLKGRVADPGKAAKEWLEDLLEFHLLQVASHPNDIEFHHQLFQEYYAAEALLGKLPTLSDTELKQKYLNYLKWTEAISFMVGLIKSENQVERLIKLALSIDLKLGARLSGEVETRFQTRTIGMITAQKTPIWLKIFLLGIAKSQEAADELLRILENSDSTIRRQAVWASRQLSSELATPVISKAIDDSAPEVRETAIRASAEVNIEWAISLATTILYKEPITSIRETAVISVLGKSISKAAILALLQASQDKDNSVRVMAVYQLKKINSQIILPILAEVLKDRTIYLSIRIGAVRLLGEIGGESVSIDLFEAQLDLNTELSQEAFHAIQKIKFTSKRVNELDGCNVQQDQYQKLKHWFPYLKSKDPVPRGNAVLHLTSLLSKNTAIDLARQFLDDPDSYSLSLEQSVQ